MKHKYQTFVEVLSDKVRTNPKTFWYFFYDISQSKAIPDTLTMVIQSILNLQPKQIYLTIIFNLFLQKISPTRCNADKVRPAEINTEFS